MSDILNNTTVLVLNRNWQAIHVRTPAEAFCQMATNAATGLEIEGQDHIRPVTWDEWITLPIRPQDQAVHTVRGCIRMPTVIVAVNYARVPKKRPKFCAGTIRERDGNRCQYTGRLLHPDEGSIDHIVPRSRGGPNSWENCVWASREVNTRKGDRLPREAGLRLLAPPRVPKELPVTMLIRNVHRVTDWRQFVQERPHRRASVCARPPSLPAIDRTTDAMIPIHELLNRIRWDPEFGRGRLEIGFFDRHEGVIHRVAFRDVEFPKSGEHLFQFTDEGGQHRRVPFHRIREVWRDGQRIWHRHAGDAKVGDIDL